MYDWVSSASVLVRFSIKSSVKLARGGGRGVINDVDDDEMEDTFLMACNFEVGSCSKLQEIHKRCLLAWCSNTPLYAKDSAWLSNTMYAWSVLTYENSPYVFAVSDLWALSYPDDISYLVYGAIFFVVLLWEEYDKVFNHLDMLNAPFKGKVFTCAKQVKPYVMEPPHIYLLPFSLNPASLRPTPATVAVGIPLQPTPTHPPLIHQHHHHTTPSSLSSPPTTTSPTIITPSPSPLPPRHHHHLVITPVTSSPTTTPPQPPPSWLPHHHDHHTIVSISQPPPPLQQRPKRGVRVDRDAQSTGEDVRDAGTYATGDGD
uniref:Uncharacterized protein n=1 Tax=Tanacetum cinerariifolium TaxID=118510 RepID=A0A6L2NBQ4_TANCI|nr:hypothetical protein [Tanacetum cinerariifolium]